MKDLHIDSSISKVLYNTTQNQARNDYAYFRELIETKYLYSGLLSYYKLGETAYQHPEKARLVLQTLLCNLSSLMKEGVVMAYHDNPAHKNLDFSLGNLQIIDQVYKEKADFYEKRKNLTAAEFQTALKGVKSTALAHRIDKFVSNAGFMEYLKRGKDPVQTYIAVLQEEIFTATSDPSPVSYLEEIVKLRHMMIHNDILPRVQADSPLHKIEKEIRLNCSIDEQLALKYVVMVLAIPPMIYSAARKAEGITAKETSLNLKLTKFFQGPQKNYGKVDGITKGNHHRRKARRGSRFNKGALGFGDLISYTLHIALVVVAIITIRAIVHNFSGHGQFYYLTDEQLTEYLATKNNYDNALLLKERNKLVSKHPELSTTAQDEALKQRAAEEEWPKKGFFRTILHVGTPRLLHFKDSSSEKEPSSNPSSFSESNETE